MVINVGSHFMSSDSEPLETFARVKAWKKKSGSDLAVIGLDRQLNLSDHIHPICLPSNHVTDDRHCSVTGWGHQSMYQEFIIRLHHKSMPAGWGLVTSTITPDPPGIPEVQGGRSSRAYCLCWSANLDPPGYRGSKILARSG